MIEELYHATPSTNLSSILEKGLVGTEEWGDDDDPSQPCIPRVHLLGDGHTAEDAAAWVSRLWCLPESEITVLRVDPSGLELLPGLDGPGSYAVSPSIPPSHLTVV